jgi:Ca2+-binding RTX toxin-like protein
MSSLNLLLANRPLTSVNINRALNTLYGNVGRNLDERNWTQILASADPLAASEAALVSMYQDPGYLLRNADSLVGLGFSANQVAYTYQQMAQRLGYTYSAAWATGTTYEQAANLGMGNLRTQAATDQENSLPLPVLALSGDGFGLLAQADVAGRLQFTNGTFVTNLTAGVNVLLGELGALTSGQLTAANALGRPGAASTQTVTLGTAGNDTYDASGAGAVVQYISTGGGNDIITGGAGADSIYAGTGDDVIRGSQEDLRLSGGDGTDRLEISTNFTVNDVFQIRSIEEIRLMVNGLTLNLTGMFFGETIRGFATGSSTVTGSNGGDRFIGGTGNDVFSGAGGLDTFTGGAGNDALTGGTDDDTFNIDAGTDTITDLQASDVFVVSTAATLNATVAQEYTATAESRNLGGGAANAVFNISTNADFANFSAITVVNAATDGITINSDSIFGGSTITGSAGADIINGQRVLNAAETLIGGAGNDTITGGFGPDNLSGGTGADTFVFYAGASRTPSATVFDVITDFGAGDVLDLGATALTADLGTGTGLTVVAGLVTAGAANLAAFVAALGNSTTTTAGSTLLYVSGADSYLFISDGTVGLANNDVLIRITGIAATAGATFTAGDITAIA